MTKLKSTNEKQNKQSTLPQREDDVLAIDLHPNATAFEKFMKGEHTWSGTLNEFLDALEGVSHE